MKYKNFANIFKFKEIDICFTDGIELKQYCPVILLKDFGPFKKGSRFCGAFCYLDCEKPSIDLLKLEKKSRSYYF